MATLYLLSKLSFFARLDVPLGVGYSSHHNAKDASGEVFLSI